MQDLTIDANVSRTQYQFVLEARRPDAARRPVAEDGRQAEDAAAVRGRVVATSQTKGLSAYIKVDRDTAARLGVSLASIDNALYDAFGQRIVSTIFTQSNQYRVILESDAGPAALARRAELDLSAVLAPGRTCRCPPSPRCEEQTAPLQVTHVGQFPAATI